MTHQNNSRYYQSQDSHIIPFKRANALERLVPEFRWDGDEGLINDFDDFDDFGEYDSDFIEPGARWGYIFSRVLRKLSGGGERTIRMGGERESQVCISDRRGLACLLVGAVLYLLDSLAFLLDDTTTGQLVYST